MSFCAFVTSGNGKLSEGGEGTEGCWQVKNLKGEQAWKISVGNG